MINSFTITKSHRGIKTRALLADRYRYHVVPKGKLLELCSRKYNRISDGPMLSKSNVSPKWKLEGEFVLLIALTRGETGLWFSMPFCAARRRQYDSKISIVKMELSIPLSNGNPLVSQPQALEPAWIMYLPGVYPLHTDLAWLQTIESQSKGHLPSFHNSCI